MELEKKVDIREESVKTVPVIIKKNPEFYKKVEDYINKASEFFGINYKEENSPIDFYDRAVY